MSTSSRFLEILIREDNKITEKTKIIELSKRLRTDIDAV
jgi:hypothetical protein